MTQGLAQQYERARMYVELKQYTMAVDDLIPIVEAAPERLDARMLLARAYYHSAQLHRAERALREIIERAPSDAYAHLMLGRTLQRQSRHEEAVGPLRLAAVMDPELAVR